MERVSRHALTDYGCTFKIYRGALVRAFDFGPRKAWKTAFVFAQAGKVCEVPVTHHPRRHGKSGWTFRKLSRFLFDHIVGISTRPFQILSLLSLTLGFLIMLRILLAWVLPGTLLTEISNGLILNSLAVIFFVLLAVLSAIGEYTFRIHSHTERDPIYVVKRRLSRLVAPIISSERTGSLN
jgi:hypothetical protein